MQASQSTRLETFKTYDQICEKDPRQDFFVNRSAGDAAPPRPRTLADLHGAVRGIELHESVPEAVREHFETARNLYVYSWFYYPFNVTAQVAAYMTVEFALRLKANDAELSFSKLLERAVANGWLTEHEFSHTKLTQPAIYRWNGNRPLKSRTPEHDYLVAFNHALVQVLPSLKYDLAPGRFLWEGAAFYLRLCADLVNQLFANPLARQLAQPRYDLRGSGLKDQRQRPG